MFYVLKVLLALLFVISLIIGSSIIMRKFHNIKLAKTGQKFKVKEIIGLDSKRKLVSLSYENKTYLLLIGQTELLLDIIDEKQIVDAGD